MVKCTTNSRLLICNHESKIKTTQLRFEYVPIHP
jgi:hypothetical protein